MDADTAEAGFERSFQATESSYKAGIASLFELEDARRSMINAKTTSIDLQRERIATWIALYRAIGGGWTINELHYQTTNSLKKPISRPLKTAEA
jgi:outer membrane protein TolC